MLVQLISVNKKAPCPLQIFEYRRNKWRPVSKLQIYLLKPESTTCNRWCRQTIRLWDRLGLFDSACLRNLRGFVANMFTPVTVMSFVSHAVSNRRQIDSLFNSLVRLTKKTHQSSELLALCEGEFTVGWWLPRKRPEVHLNVKMSPYQYRDPHVKDKTVSRLSYL